MNNNFTKKGFIQKLIIMLIFLTIFNFIYPYIPSFAEESIEEQNSNAVGGILAAPVISLVTTIGDGIVVICQNMILGMESSFIHVNNKESTISRVVGIIAGGAAAIAVFGISIATAGAGIPVIVAGVHAIGGAALTGIVVGGAASAFTKYKLPDDFYIPVFAISPAEIFSNSIPAFDINFINPKKEYQYTDEKGNVKTKNIDDSPAKVLQKSISSWYVTLRNFVLVSLMIVLLYIGIRIVISSTASEKAKYKQHIQDWITAVVIVVFMHYIMAFALSITEKITEVLASKNEVVVVGIPEPKGDLPDDVVYTVKDDVMYIPTNFMGQARLYQQLEQDEDGNAVYTWDRIGYTIIYIVLVIYTLMFIIIYLKRVIYMAFLTVIAPLVALTYPIDKMSDGSAQAFNMWLKEYIFNLLLQPFHLLIYTLLIGSAMDLATTNMLYAVVAIGFLLPAEKLLRKFFGFEKASTTGSIMGGAVGGALAMSAISTVGKLLSGGKGKKGSGKGENGEGSSNEDNGRIRTMDSGNSTDDLLTEGLGENNSNTTTTARGTQGQRQNSSENSIANDPNRLESVERGKQYLGNKMNNIRNSNFGQNVGNLYGTARNNLQGVYGATLGRAVNRVRNPKTALGRDGKKLAIRGFKTGGALLKTGGHYVGKMAPTVAKTIGRAYGAATLGTLGVAAGLASDDYKNVLSYGAAAAGVGASIGDNPVDMIASTVSGTKQKSEEVADTYMKNRYSASEYKEKVNSIADKKFLKDKDAINLYKEKFGDKDYKNAMQDALEYRKYGVTDDKMIIKAMKLKDAKSASATSKERISYAKIASTAKTEKELEDYSKRLKDNGLDDEMIKNVKRIVRGMQD